MKILSSWQSCPQPLQEFLVAQFQWHDAWNVLRVVEPSGNLKWENVDLRVLERCKHVGTQSALRKVSLPFPPSLSSLPSLQTQKAAQNKKDGAFDWVYSASIVGHGKHVVMNPPKWQRSFRFARKFGADRFLFLQNANGLSDLELAGRRFRHLTHGDGEVVLFAESGHGLEPLSIQSVLDWHIPIHHNLGMTLGKYTSRVSLGFSPTTPTLQIADVRALPDVKAPTWQKQVMTDGCGLISWSAMQMIQRQLGLATMPSAVQARFGPAKGVWHVSMEQLCSDDSDVWIAVRPSQTKYTLARPDLLQSTLEVVRVSSPSKPGKLNGQFIAMLENGGVPSDTLVGMYSDWLVEMRQELQSNVLAALKTMLRTSTIVAPELLQLLQSGFGLATPHVAKLVQRAHLAWLRAQLVKPMMSVEKSATLICIPDPTGKLLPNQVYLNPSHAGKAIVGNVLVSRTPCLLPWDMQKVEAVAIPELQHLQDVVVFSIQGARPLVQLLSGGDYDGDLIWACWDKRLMSFTNSEVADMAVDGYFVRDTVTIGDIVQRRHGMGHAMLQHQKTESANRSLLAKYHGLHIKSADMYGFNHTKSIRLGMMLSRLVDATKHGWTLVKQTQQRDVEDGLMFPHWHGKSPSRRSTRARGRIYNAIQQHVETLEAKLPCRSVQSVLDRPKLDPDLTVHVDERLQPDVEAFVKSYTAQLSAHLKAKAPTAALDQDTKERWREFTRQFVEKGVAKEAVVATAFSVSSVSNPSSAFLWTILVDDLCLLKKQSLNK